MNGQRDYMMMLNERDGGVNGVKLGYEECETGYSTEKGVECYEKTKATGIVTQPWSTGITLQVLPKTNVDKIPILAPGYGFSPMTDGKVFQWAFNPPASYWDGAVDDPQPDLGRQPRQPEGQEDRAAASRRALRQGADPAASSRWPTSTASPSCRSRSA